MRVQLRNIFPYKKYIDLRLRSTCFTQESKWTMGIRIKPNTICQNPMTELNTAELITPWINPSLFIYRDERCKNCSWQKPRRREESIPQKGSCVWREGGDTNIDRTLSVWASDRVCLYRAEGSRAPATCLQTKDWKSVSSSAAREKILLAVGYKFASSRTYG